jgi:hypothetical protein
MQEGAAGSLDVADRLADEALRWAQVSGDDWAIAMAASALARAARSAEELRTRVDAAATLLERVGNLYQLARLLSAATYIALIHGSAQDARVFADRAAPLIQRLEDPQTAMFFAGNAGLAALFAGDAEAARATFREQLRLCRALVYLPASEGLSGLAAVAAVDGDFERAARLRGAAGAHRYGEPIDAVDARLQTAYFEPARRQHGPDAWHAAERQGAALSVEDAIAYGLEETQSQPTASCPIPHRNHDIDGPLFVPVTPGHARFSRQRPSA